jgi:hypothetical protein
LSQYKTGSIRNSHAIIINSAADPLDSILPSIAPEAFTFSRSAADMHYFVGAAEENTIQEFHDIYRLFIRFIIRP